MDRLFVEVFPTLKINNETKKKLEGMSVVKIALSADRRTLKVYLTGSRYVQRSLIRQIEREISVQLFSGKRSIHIIDDYISLKTLHLLCGVDKMISMTIISDNLRGLLHLSDYQDCQRENPGFRVDFIRSMGASHDRFIMLDHQTENERLFHCGPSSKDSGNRISAISEFCNPEIRALFSRRLSVMLENPPLQWRQ